MKAWAGPGGAAPDRDWSGVPAGGDWHSATSEQSAQRAVHLPVNGTVSAQRSGLKGVRGDDQSLNTDPNSPGAWFSFLRLEKDQEIPSPIGAFSKHLLPSRREAWQKLPTIQLEEKGRTEPFASCPFSEGS